MPLHSPKKIESIATEEEELSSCLVGLSDSTPPTIMGHGDLEGCGEDVGWDELDGPTYFLVNSSFVVAQEAMCYPLDLLKTRQQWDRSLDLRNSRTGKLAADVFRHEGVWGFYRGFGVSVACQWPGHMLYFGGYELAKHTLKRSVNPGNEIQMAAVNLTAGFIADLVALLAFTPGEVVTQRLMIATMRRPLGFFNHQTHAPPAPRRRPPTAAAVVRAVVQNEGYAGGPGRCTDLLLSARICWLFVYNRQHLLTFSTTHAHMWLRQDSIEGLVPARLHTARRPPPGGPHMRPAKLDCICTAQ